MVQPNHSVHELQPLRRAQRPALRQHFVVDIFQAHAGDFAKDVQRIQDFLKINQADLPRLTRVALFCESITDFNAMAADRWPPPASK